VDKAYEAVVAGVVADDEGTIDKALLRVDAVKRSGDPSRVEVVEDHVPGAKLSWSVWKSTSASGELSHFSSMMRPRWPTSSGEETAPPRRRAGVVASMAWRSMRRFSTSTP
jgi:hypothetical protein